MVAVVCTPAPFPDKSELMLEKQRDFDSGKISPMSRPTQSLKRAGVSGFYFLQNPEDIPVDMLCAARGGFRSTSGRNNLSQTTKCRPSGKQGSHKRAVYKRRLRCQIKSNQVKSNLTATLTYNQLKSTVLYSISNQAPCMSCPGVTCESVRGMGQSISLATDISVA